MTWNKVQQTIDKHNLPYRIERFNMSHAGVLVDADTRGAVAYTAKDAYDFLTRYATAYLKARYAEQAEKYPTLRNDVTEQGYVAENLTYAMRNMHRRTFTKEMVGSPIRLIGFNHDSTEPDTIYHGNLVEILPRGIRISYYVPSVQRECETTLSTKDAKQRVTVV